VPAAVAVARLLYLGVILLATLTGLDPDPHPDRVRERLAGALDLSIRPADAVDGAGNILLFAGWGAVWLITAPGTRLLRRVLEATLTGAALSVLVETAQLVSATRTSSVLDVATNTAGAFAGAAFMLALAWSVHLRRGARSFVGVPAYLFVLGYGAAVALEAFIPLFESAMLPGAAGGPAARLSHALAQFEPASLRDVPLLHLVLFPPAAAFAVAALVELGVAYRQAWPRVAAAGAVLAAAVELAGGAAGHAISAGAVLTNAAALALGAWAAARWLPAATTRLRGRRRPLALLVCYAVLLMLWSWRPLLPETSTAALLAQLAPDRLVPLAAHAARFDLFSVVDLLRQFALLVPVGALLAVWPLRRSGWLAGPLPGVYAAGVLESGQLLVAARYFDATDALVGAAAVLMGWVVVRRSGFTPYGSLLPRRPDRPPPPDRPRRHHRAQPRREPGTGGRRTTPP
jgi:glycopeptide antibiotics resistance protein